MARFPTNEIISLIGETPRYDLIAFVLRDRDDGAVTVSPMPPLARNTLEAVGATIRTVSLSFDDGYRLEPADIGPKEIPLRGVCVQPDGL